MEKQKGVSLIITLFIMIVILAVVLSVSTILYSEIKVIKNISNSVVAFYAADSGVEKVLYYDKKVIPDEAERGFCSMCSSNACTTENSNHSMDCLDCQLTVLNDDPTGCDPDICNNCEISFNTDFDGKTYNVIAAVSPGAGDSSILEIKSKGFFGGTGRKIDILTQKLKGQGALKIENASVDHMSIQRGETINISADVSTTDSGGVINNVYAIIQDSQGNTVATIPKSSFECTGCFESKYRSGHWEYDWNSSESGAYYVSFSAGDSLGNEVTENILTTPTGPSFEVYSPGEHSYPSVSHISVDVAAGDATVTANITDVSGVLSATAEIQGLTDIYTMQKISGSYVAYIGGLNPGDYTVEIFATDNLLIKNPAGTYTKKFKTKP